MITDDDHQAQSNLLTAWLDQPGALAPHRFLEQHPALLDPQSDLILRNSLAHQQNPEASQRTRDALSILSDARGRGRTASAVRQAYINVYGGLVLDLPPWLEEVRHQLEELNASERHHETVTGRMTLLRSALKRAENTPEVAPEVLAALHLALAIALCHHAGTDRAQALEDAAAECRMALRIYTLAHYPRQYAEVQNTLGDVYRERIAEERQENLEQALVCYHEALRVFSLEMAPLKYALIQSNLGEAYYNRIMGERRENLEQAIVYYHEALRVRTPAISPYEYAETQNNLGNAYYNRIMGERRENLEEAIACHREALRICTLEAFPYYYAIIQDNLGVCFRERITGERRENLEEAIACHREALRVRISESFPYHYAWIQTNLGLAYQARVAGQKSENVEQSLACYSEALRVYTLEAFPQDYALVQNKLGNAYRDRCQGERQENFQQALACYREALRIYTIEASPRDFRDVQLSIAETEAQCGNWAAVHSAYVAAQEAEDLLVALGAGTVGRDAILREGRDSAVHNGYALTRLGQVAEAATAIERGRARGLTDATQLDAAHPSHIHDADRRARYITARQKFVDAQADLHTLLLAELDENAQRHLDLEHTMAYRDAKNAFDGVVADIRAAQDPADFLNQSIDATTILRAVQRGGSGHGLVYLVATPWGGVAVAALTGQPAGTHGPSHFEILDLPALTSGVMSELIETRLDEGSDRVVGGFYAVQQGNALEALQYWSGATIREQAASLHAECQAAQRVSSLDATLQNLLFNAHPAIASLFDAPLETLSDNERADLSATLSHEMLQLELQRCFTELAHLAMHPLALWLRTLGVTHLTLIPCGFLAAFPLASIPLLDGCTLAEAIPTSIAPNARFLLADEAWGRVRRAGIYALGNPKPMKHELRWGEAEARTLSALARHMGYNAQVGTEYAATRAWLIDALQSGRVVAACCHGQFDARTPLRSRLLLANGEELALAEMLSHEADLRSLDLLILSACQTALLDVRGARDEVRSFAMGMLQAGARAVLATQWAIDDEATYLLIVRFAQEWFPHMDTEPPAAALARAQQWLRTVTNRDLQMWRSLLPVPRSGGSASTLVERERWIPVRGRGSRLEAPAAQEWIRLQAAMGYPDTQPYTDPYYWAGFQIYGQ